MADEPPGGRDQTIEALRLAEAVQAFSSDPAVVVRVVASGSPEWQRYAEWAREEFLATDRDGDVRSRGLVPGAAPKERDPVWRSRRAAWEAFRGQAEYAVIAAHGDSRMFTVATFARTGNVLTVRGAGSTHGGIGGARVDGVPTAGQFGDAVWYSLSRFAAKDHRGLVDPLPSTTWRGPRTQLERPVIIGADADWRQLPRELRLSAAEVEQLAITATSRLPGLRSRFEALEKPLGEQMALREAAVRIGRLYQRGLRIHVVEPGGLGHRDDAVPRAEMSSLVVELNGKLLATGRIGRSADGGIQILDTEGNDADADRALWLVACREAARFGVGVDRDGYQLSTASEAVQIAAFVDRGLRSQPDTLPRLNWHAAAAPGAAPGPVAKAAAAFVDAGGDVVRLTPDDPQYEVMKERVAGLMAEALSVDLEDNLPRDLGGAVGVDPAVDEGLAGIWQAFNPPTGAIGAHGPARTKLPPPYGTAVAVALGPDGTPQAAVGYRETSERIELGPVGGVSQAGGGPIAAAVVEGVYRTANGRPVGGYVEGPYAETYARAGLSTGGPEAVDATWLTGVEMSGPETTEMLVTTSLYRAGNAPESLDFIADQLRNFAESPAELVVTDHATPAGRRYAEYVRRVVVPDQDRQAGPALDTLVDYPHRVTLAVLDRGQPVACATVDSRPGEPITIIGPVHASDPQNQAALHWWLANHQVRQERPMQYSDGKSWDLHTSKTLIAGVHNRLHDRVDGIAQGAGSITPNKPEQAARQEGPGADRPNPGTGRRPDRPHGQER